MGITGLVRTLASPTGPVVTGLLASSNKFWIAFVAGRRAAAGVRYRPLHHLHQYSAVQTRGGAGEVKPVLVSVGSMEGDLR